MAVITNFIYYMDPHPDKVAEEKRKKIKHPKPMIIYMDSAYEDIPDIKKQTMKRLLYYLMGKQKKKIRIYNLKLPE